MRYNKRKKKVEYDLESFFTVLEVYAKDELKMVQPDLERYKESNQNARRHLVIDEDIYESLVMKKKFFDALESHLPKIKKILREHDD